MCSRWCFTLNLQTDEPAEYAESWLTETAAKPHVAYLHAQLEEAPTTGQNHIQGYIEVTERLSMASLKGLLEQPSIHLERARGSADQNDAYVSKSESRLAGPWKFGEHLVQGRRSDLDDIKTMLDAGTSLKDIATAHPGSYIRYHKGIMALQAALDDTPRDWMPSTKVFVGPTGTGKSRTAHAEAGPRAYVLCDPQGKWWDGYHGQHAVIIDDFRGEIEFTWLLKLLDRYPMQVQTKGGWTNFKPRFIWITSNLDIELWYLNMDIAPLRRRILDIRHFS